MSPLKQRPAFAIPIGLLAAFTACAQTSAVPTPGTASRQPATSSPASSTSATSATSDAVGVEGITAEDIYRRVAFLASDEMRGRDTPSPGLDSAAAYLAGEHRRLGLEPAGENGTFYQRYPFPLIRLNAEGAQLRFAGTAEAQNLAYGRDYFATGGTAEPISTTLVYVGRGLETVGEGDALRGSVAVAALPGSGATRDFRVLLGSQAAQAQAGGASAIVHILDPQWSTGAIKAAAEGATRSRRRLGAGPGFPQIFLKYDAAAKLFSAAGLDLEALWKQALLGEALPVAIPGITIAAALPEEFLDRATAPNVVAVLEGSDPQLRNEYVILSAHMDHVGVGAPVRGDSIYNGADDDASGTSALVEVAEAFASLPNRPRRSIVFLHVSGEEHGLLGSEWFSEHPTVPLDRVVANVNVDMIGRNGPDTVVVIGKNYSSLGSVANAAQARHPELGLTLSDDIWPEERFFFRSDHFNFARKEIPSLFFFSGVHEDYHRPSDEVEKLDVDKAARISRMIFYVVQEIANEPARPTWDPAGLAEVRSLTQQ